VQSEPSSFQLSNISKHNTCASRFDFCAALACSAEADSIAAACAGEGALPALRPAPAVTLTTGASLTAFACFFALFAAFSASFPAYTPSTELKCWS
jgi:hypothetical protein